MLHKASGFAGDIGQPQKNPKTVNSKDISWIVSRIVAHRHDAENI